MIWLILGGSGQLGQTLIKQLEEHGYREVYSPDSKVLNISSPEVVSSYIEQLNPQIIVNCAAYTDVDSAEIHQELADSINANGVRNIAIAGRAVKALFYHISTDYVFSGDSIKPWREEEIKAPINIYGLSKSRGEDMAIEEYIHGTRIFRTSGLYSPYGSNIAKFIIKKALFSNDIINCVVNQYTQPTSSKDLAERIIVSYENNLECGIYHATNGGATNWYEFAKVIFECIGSPIDRLVAVQDTFFVRKATRPRYSVLGHDNWNRNGIGPMRDWKMGLVEILPQLILTVQKETKYGV